MRPTPDCDAANVVAHRSDFARVETAADVDAELLGRGSDGERAGNGSAGPITAE